MGTAFVAWAPRSAQKAWFDRLAPTVSNDTRDALERTLAEVRAAGYSVGRGHRWHSEAAQVLSRDHPDLHRDETAQQMHQLIATLPPDYESPTIDADDVRTVSTPVFGPGGAVVLVLSVTVAGRRSLAADLGFTVERLRAAAAAVTEALDGAPPKGESA
jgi:DNA-binding IclR family transcriptional regulator